MHNPPILLIHGLWMTPQSFENWIDRFTYAGHEVCAPAWPGMEGEVEALRRDPAPIAPLTITKILDHYTAIIKAMPTPPIIMGHSFGGAFTQILIDRGLGAAGVAIDSAAVKGINKLPWSTLRTGWPILRNPINRHRAVPINLKQFHYRFTNHLSVAQSSVAYDRYCIPATGHVLFEGATANFNPKAATKVNFRNDRRPPLLLIAGGIDHVSPPSLNRSNFHHYRRSHAVTDYKEFPGRSHFTLGQSGWEAVADYALDWAVRHCQPNSTFQSSAPAQGVGG